MKVQLEQKLSSCSPQLGCVVCQQPFTVPAIRTLLCTDTGLIQGDICPACLKLKATGMRQQMQRQSRSLLEQASCHNQRSLSLRQRALDLAAWSQEPLTLPNFYQWLCKRLEILSQETQELESARLGLHACTCGQRSRLRIVFEDEGNCSD